MKPVAIFRSLFGSKFGTPRQSGLADITGEVCLCDEYKRAEALRGLDSFSYLWLIWEFSENADREWQATVRPPRLGGNRSMGVFATRSPFRPNPLGLSSVKIEKIDFEKCIIKVRGADLIDGTPVYDIKPYLEYADSHIGAGNGFADKYEWKKLEVEFSAGLEEELEAVLSEEEMAVLKEVLALDPRPHYQNDHEKGYGFPFKDIDIRFKVKNGKLTVYNIIK